MPTAARGGGIKPVMLTSRRGELGNVDTAWLQILYPPKDLKVHSGPPAVHQDCAGNTREK